MKLIAVLLAITTLPLAAQWLNYPDARTPRTKDGKPNLTAPAPQINGKPDLSGVWQAERTPRSELTRVLGNNFANVQVDYNDITKQAMDVFWGMKPDEEPLRPEAAAILKQRAKVEGPSAACLPAGIPAGIFIYPFQMIQAPREIVILTENGDPARQIHTDGRSLPRTYSLPGWGTRWGIGKATRWWSTQSALSKQAGSIYSAIRAANRCASVKLTTAAILDKSIWK